MPRKAEHLGKAHHDEQFVSSLDLSTSPFIDWAVTALFYAALHYVEAYFATMNRHSADHRARDSAIRRDANLRKIYNDYSELKNHSINARYYMTPFVEADVTRHLRPRFNALKSYITSLL